MHQQHWFLVVLLALSGCAQQGPAPYAPRYAAALEHYPGTPMESTAGIDAFVQFFSSHGDGDALSAAELYADRLYFSDTLLTSENHAEVVAHLERMRSGSDELGVTVLQQQIDGADVYLVWRMQARFTPVRSPVLSDSIGITHLRFDATGRIVLQQDFWDSSEGFYRHLPLVGALLDRIARSFQSDAS